MPDVERLDSTVAHPTSGAGDVLLDGLFTGAIGALAVAAWFFAIDALQGRPFFTPALLGTLILHGSEAAQDGPIVAPLEVVAYTFVHFIAFALVGLLLSWLMSLFERFPIVGFVLLVLFLCLQLGFLVLNTVLGARLAGELPMWSVAVANLLAALGMLGYQWRLHPGALRRVDRLWDDS